MIKININFNIDEKCFKWARDINQTISAITDNDIDFVLQDCKPHITLLMGEVEEKDFETVKNIVSAFNPKSIKQDFKLLCPYKKGLYILSHLQEWAEIKEDCLNLLELLKDFIIPNKHSICYGNVPHLTLGYCEDCLSLTQYLNSIKTAPSLKLQSLSVNFAGAHGIALNHTDENENKKIK